MFNRIFPKIIDNHLRGNILALVFLLPITFMQIAISLLHIFSKDGGAQSISTIPLDTYSAGAAQNVIALFSRLGLEQFLFGLILVVVLLRYRAMIPFMYLLILVGYAASEGIVFMKPLATVGEFGASTPALVLLILSISGFALSLVGKGYSNGKGAQD